MGASFECFIFFAAATYLLIPVSMWLCVCLSVGGCGADVHFAAFLSSDGTKC